MRLKRQGVIALLELLLAGCAHAGIFDPMTPQERFDEQRRCLLSPLCRTFIADYPAELAAADGDERDCYRHARYAQTMLGRGEIQWGLVRGKWHCWLICEAWVIDTGWIAQGPHIFPVADLEHFVRV